MTNELYDVAIVGGGPAAHSAALYARRKELKTVMIAKEEGGQLLYSSEIDNYLGLPDVEAFELVKKFRNPRGKYDPEKIEDEGLDVEKDEERFLLKLDRGKEIKSRTLIVAAGAKW